MAVETTNAANLRMLALRLVNTADEAAGPTNAERDSQMKSSPTTASWPPYNISRRRDMLPRPSAPFMATQHPAPFNTDGSLGGKTSRRSRSDRPGSSSNRSSDLSSVVSDLSNLSCLDNVQLCRAVANGSIQLDDERPRTRKELRRAAKREAKLRRAARAHEDIDQANTNSTIQLANRQPLDARFHEVGQEDKQRLKQLIQTIEGRPDLIESQMDTLRRMRCRADRHTAVMSLAHARLHYERNKIKRTDSLENFKVYQEDSNRRFQEAYRAARKKGFAPATAMEQAKQNVPDSDLARPSRAWPRALWQETREKIIGRIWPPPQSNPGRRERGGKALEP